MSTDLAKLLDTLIAKAPGLREAGVLELAVDGVSAKLAPHEPVVETSDEDKTPDNYADAMLDPALYGGSVPGYTLRTKS